MAHKISVLLPSAFPEKRAQFLASLKAKSHNYEALEIIIVIDGNNEDWWDGNTLYTYHEPTNFRTKFFEHAYRKSTGDWLWLANDDLEILTQDWNKDLDLEDPWRLYHFKDNDYNGEFACHPLTSRKVWELMDQQGLVFPPYVNMGCDTTIWDVMPYVKRKYKSNVVFEHRRFLDQKKHNEILEDYKSYNQNAGARAIVRHKIHNYAGIEEPRVLIAVPTGEYARKPEVYTHIDMMDKPSTTVRTTSIGHSPARGRNIMIQQALDGDFTHVFFIDDDMILAKTALTKLLSHDVDIVSGLYLHRNHPHRPLIFDQKLEDGQCRYHLLSKGEEGLIEIVNAGLGCTLIKTRVFRNMEKPWIRLAEMDKDDWNDDIGFFNRVTKAGFKVYCDLDVKCGHVLSAVLWPFRLNTGEWCAVYDTKGQEQVMIPLLTPESYGNNTEPEPALTR